MRSNPGISLNSKEKPDPAVDVTLEGVLNLEVDLIVLLHLPKGC
jgi:hypothetical protein